MFDNVLKIALVETKLSIKVVSFYVQDQQVLKIKIWDLSQTRFDSTNSLAVSDLPHELLLENSFFDVSFFALLYLPSQYIYIFGAPF